MNTPADLNPDELIKNIEEATRQVKENLQVLRGQGDEISLVDMFQMEMLMNKLSQLSEMSASVVSASNQAIASMARSLKS